MKRIFLILLLGAAGMASFGKGFIPVNQRNAAGQKQGFWVEDNGYRECYYRDGLLHGVCKVYSKQSRTGILPRILAVGEFDRGNHAGTWYVFDQFYGLASHKINKIRLLPDGKGYCASITFYYPSGRIRAKATIFYPKGIMNCYEYDLWAYQKKKKKLVQTKDWQYYDENGNLIN